MSERHRVFQVLQKDFTSYVNLQNLIPLLNDKRLLTESEEQDLTNTYHSEYNRILELTKILRRKGPSCPMTVLECLQNSGDDGHTHLAGLMQRFFQSDTVATGMRSEQNSEVQPNADTPRDQNPGPSGSMAADRGDDRPMQVAESEELSQRSLVEEQHDSVHSLGHNASSPQEQTRSHSHAPCRQPPMSRFSPQYSQLIKELSFELAQRGIGIETILETLNLILQTDGISIFTEESPTEVTSFNSLCSYLNDQGMCHETDTDLWCKLFAQLQLDDLLTKVHSYARSISTAPIMEYQSPSAVQPLQRHMLVFTYHNSTSLTVGQVYEIKTFLASLSDIPRHTFTFSEPQTGSIILVWRFPTQLSKHCTHSLESQEVHNFKILSHNHTLARIELQLPASTQRETIYTATSSGTDVGSISGVGSPGPSVSLPTSPPKAGDDVVSSTVNDCDSPPPVEQSIHPSAGT